MEMRIKAMDFWKSVPIQHISDGVIVSKTGDITIGWEITLPGIFTCDALSLLEIPEALSKAISFLPPWMMVHRQDVYYRRGYPPQKRASFLGYSYETRIISCPYWTRWSVWWNTCPTAPPTT